MLMTLLKIEDGHARKTNHVIRGLGFEPLGICPDLAAGEGSGYWAICQCFNWSCLLNEALIKTMDTKASRHFLGWHYSGYCHTLMNQRLARPQRWWPFTFETPPDLSLCVSPLGCFWFVSFFYNKTMIISMELSWVPRQCSDFQPWAGLWEPLNLRIVDQRWRSSGNPSTYYRCWKWLKDYNLSLWSLT